MNEKDSSTIPLSHLLIFISILIVVTVLIVTGFSFIHIVWYATLALLSLGLILAILTLAAGLIPETQRRQDDVGIQLGLVHKEPEYGDETDITGFIPPVLVLIVPAACVLLSLWIFGLEPDATGIPTLILVLKGVALVSCGVGIIWAFSKRIVNFLKGVDRKKRRH